MANINVTWTALGAGVDDVDSVEVVRCDDGSKTTEAHFQAALDAVHPGNDYAAQGLVSVENGLGKTSSALTTPDSVGVGTYYYCVAAKNTGGYKVGAGDNSAVDSIVVA